MLHLFLSAVPTGAVERLGQLSGHDLDDEANAETEHLAEELGLSPYAHGQVNHNLLGEEGRLKGQAGDSAGQRCVGGSGMR